MSVSGLVNKEAFAAAQVEMTRTWYDNLNRSGRDVEAYVATRFAAYLARWREAGRYIGRDKKLLDIGGGHVSDAIFAYFRQMGWDYWYADVGEVEVEATRQRGERFGYAAAQFSRRLNHELTYEPESFDAVFSSHCLEHSMDLELTLRQINLLLKPGGDLVASVPFGWDRQPNHPYFLNQTEWLTLIEDAGFQIRAYQIGGELPESGEDLMIAARKSGPASRFRLDVGRYAKAGFEFRDFRDSSVHCLGTCGEKQDHLILDGDWRAEIALEAGVTEALPIFVRHDWSGVVRVASGDAQFEADLFRPQPSTEVYRLNLKAPAAPGQRLVISPIGRRDASRGNQAVLVGLMTR